MPVREGIRGLGERGAFHAWRLITRKRVDTLRYSGYISASTYCPWRADEQFLALYEKIRNNTLVRPARLHELYDLALQLERVEGDILEVGVWRGGSGCLLASVLAHQDPSGTVFLADTFSGVVKAGEKDPNYKGGEHADTSEAIVKSLANDMGCTNVELVVGIFPDDLEGRLDDRVFKLVHVDVDTYGSAKAVTEWAWDRLSSGGVVVFDDFGTPTTSGVREFVDEFRGRPGAVVINNMNQHAIVVKTA